MSRRRRRHSEGDRLPPLLFVDSDSESEDEYEPSRRHRVIMHAPPVARVRGDGPLPLAVTIATGVGHDDDYVPLETSLSQLLDNVEREKLPRSFEDLEFVEIIDHYPGEECNICMYKYNKGSKSKVVTHCGHTLCKQCMSGIINAAYGRDVYGERPSYELVSQKISCPFCRSPVRFGSRKKKPCEYMTSGMDVVGGKCYSCHGYHYTRGWIAREVNCKPKRKRSPRRFSKSRRRKHGKSRKRGKRCKNRRKGSKKSSRRR